MLQDDARDRLVAEVQHHPFFFELETNSAPTVSCHAQGDAFPEQLVAHELDEMGQDSLFQLLRIAAQLLEAHHISGQQHFHLSSSGGLILHPAHHLQDQLLQDLLLAGLDPDQTPNLDREALGELGLQAQQGIAGGHFQGLVACPSEVLALLARLFPELLGLLFGLVQDPGGTGLGLAHDLFRLGATAPHALPTQSFDQGLYA